MKAIIVFLCLSASLFGQTDPRMVVAWAAVTGAAKYRVETTVGSLPFALAAECPTSPCTVPNVEGASTYKIRVAGVKPNGEIGDFSTPISFVFASIQPLSPTSLSQQSAASTQPGKLAKSLSWTPVTKFRTGPLIPSGAVIEYRIYQAGTSQAVSIATTQASSYTVQGLQKNKSFQFYVTCVVNGVESFTSPAVRVNT